MGITGSRRQNSMKTNWVGSILWGIVKSVAPYNPKLRLQGQIFWTTVSSITTTPKILPPPSHDSLQLKGWKKSDLRCLAWWISNPPPSWFRGNTWPSGFSQEKRASPRGIVERNAKSTSPASDDTLPNSKILGSWSQSKISDLGIFFWADLISLRSLRVFTEDFGDVEALYLESNRKCQEIQEDGGNT